MGAQRILVIEDEKQIVRLLELELRHEGYAVDAAYDGIAGVTLAEADPPDLILLDVMLPGLNGLEVCRRIRKPFRRSHHHAHGPGRHAGQGDRPGYRRHRLCDKAFRHGGAARADQGGAEAQRRQRFVGDTLSAGGLVVDKSARTAGEERPAPSN